MTARPAPHNEQFRPATPIFSTSPGAKMSAMSRGGQISSPFSGSSLVAGPGGCPAPSALIIFARAAAGAGRSDYLLPAPIVNLAVICGGGGGTCLKHPNRPPVALI